MRVERPWNFWVFVGGVAVLVVDQVTKYLIPSKTINTGVAFGMGREWLLVELVVLGALGCMGLLLIRARQVWERAVFTVIMAAGMSNLVDRVVFGGVRDFIFWPLLNVYGNIADVMLVAATVFWVLKTVQRHLMRQV